jgi:5'-3' exonuclease/20S proteasome alpha/beta subunit
MGVPKFFRWLSERYPKVIQRHGCPPNAETTQEHFGTDPPTNMPKPDPLSTCGLAPEIDRLYIDMNGIIHGCSHNNSEAEENGEEGVANISEDEIFRNICYYLDRVVKDIAKPKQLVYMAIDGVAPRAKLNQQRSRRYRSGKEGEIERTVYDAHLEAMERERERNRQRKMEETGDFDDEINLHSQNRDEQREDEETLLTEVEPGRFTGKFETHESDSTFGLGDESADSNIFHSNVITPGTSFFSECTKHIEHFIQFKLSTDPAWKDLDIIFSGPNVPGEGEHKIMEFMRQQKSRPDYDPNLRHCIMGQDGDLIMLGLVTHEPNLFLLREQVIFDRRRNDRLAAHGLDAYIHNPNFEFLHMNILRDYFAFEFETSNVWPESPYDLERTIDDFVFMTFFVGNDFLPHMPALDIADEAFDLLFYTYRSQREKWLSQKEEPYLTNAGNIASGERLESFLGVVGAHESSYYDYKKSTEDPGKARTLEAKWGMVTTPSDEILASKEQEDRSRFRGMLEQSVEQKQRIAVKEHLDFTPVMSSIPSYQEKSDKEDDGKGLFSRMGHLLQFSVPDKKNDTQQKLPEPAFDVTDVKGRYYADKFGFSPFDAEKHIALRKAYVEGLVWNLKYYYEGCISWEWYYPFHYGPMISDLVGVDGMLREVSFDGKMGSPLKPFEQLMACMPPSHSHLLPEPYRWLMTDPSSPISQFYPRSFTVDMNGKRWPWEAVVMLPFIDSERLLSAANSVSPELLSEAEVGRNEFKESIVWLNDASSKRDLEATGIGKCFDTVKDCTAVSIPFVSSQWRYPGVSSSPPIFKPEVKPGTQVPLSGLPTLRDGSVHSMWRKRLKVNVHGNISRYTTALLQLHNSTPEGISILQLAPHLIGTTIFINYPVLIEALVTAVSDSQGILRGEEALRQWTSRESTGRKSRLKKVINGYITGEGYTGTGGLTITETRSGAEELETLLYVRPIKGLRTMADGTVVKSFAKFEVEVPLFVKSWAPVSEDKRLESLPALLEKDPYNAAKRVLTYRPDDEDSTKENVNAKSNQRSRGYQEKIDLIPDDEITGITVRATSMSSLLYGLPSQSRAFGTLSKKMKPTSREFCTLERPGLNCLTSNRAIVRPAFFAEVNPLRTAATFPRRGRIFALGAIFASLFSSVGAIELGRKAHLQSSPTDDFSRNKLFAQREARNDVHLGDEVELLPPDVGSYPPPPPLEFAHGTTTLSFVFQGGIVAAVDSRASLGSFVGSKTTQKVLPINSHMLGTMAGGAADCSFWIRKLQGEAAMHVLTLDGRRMSVARASRLLSNALYDNRKLGLSVGTMVMGFDDTETKSSRARIFYVDNSGTRIEGDVFAVGSGSTFALGILDTEKRHDLTVDEAVALGLKAIRHATFRDAYSGGFINVYLITHEHGWQRVFSQDLACLSGRESIPNETPLQLE